ncbi:MAG: lyase family protein, partial [Halobacteria archaeon]|nr:lyase family protein [Halobacteria archaeon]
DRYASSSSIMPQKKNPDTAELARGKAANVHGALNAVLTNLKGLPMAYNRDLQELTQHIWDAFETTRESVRVIRGAVETADFDEETMEESVSSGFTGATELADVLVRETGMAFRTAHHIVGKIASEAGDDGNGVDAETVNEVASEVTGDEIDIDDKTVEDALDARRNVELRDSLGAPGEIAEALEQARENLDEDLDTLNKLEENLTTSKDSLRDAIQNLKENQE